MSDVETTGDLRSTLSLLRRRRLVVGVAIVGTLAAAAVLTARETPEYTSRTTVQVSPFDPDQGLTGFGWTFVNAMQSEATIANSPAIGEEAARLVQPRALDDTGTMTATNPPDTTILVFAYEHPEPEIAQAWAQAYAEAYVEERTERANALYDAKIAPLEAQVDTLQTLIVQAETDLETARGTDRQSIQARLNQLYVQQASYEAQKLQVPMPYDAATEVVADATYPGFPSSPRPFRNAALALALGVVLGISAAFVRDRLDDRTVGKRDVELEIGAPVLGVIPRVDGWKKRSAIQLVARQAPRGPAAEAYRTIRTNLRFLSQTEGVRVIAVTSANLGEGKTTTTANLAVSLAQADVRVIAISADLRKPRLHRFFGLENVTGLSDVLQGHIGFATAAQRTGMPTLRVVASGPVPAHPAELLSSPRMERLIEDLRGLADLVLIDTPPVLAVSDTLPLARMVDAVVVVADASATTRSALRHVREQLEQVGARIAGGIYNGYDPARAGDRGYYGYGGYEEAKPRRRRSDEVAEIPAEPADAERIWD